MTSRLRYRVRQARYHLTRRRYYRLTSLGRGVLAAETDRLGDVVREARLRLQVAKPRRA